jgi:hypothetical protein
MIILCGDEHGRDRNAAHLVGGFMDARAGAGWISHAAKTKDRELIRSARARFDLISHTHSNASLLRPSNQSRF